MEISEVAWSLFLKNYKVPENLDNISPEYLKSLEKKFETMYFLAFYLKHFEEDLLNSDEIEKVEKLAKDFFIENKTLR